MGLAIKIVLLLVFVAVTASIVLLFVSFCGLLPRRSGCAGERFAELVCEKRSLLPLWESRLFGMAATDPCWCCFMVQAIKREHGTKWRLN